MKFSILIPALSSRLDLRVALTESLCSQMRAQKGVELIVLEDNGRMTSGHKRNELLKLAKGEYIAYIDDDDMIRDNYISRIISAMNGSFNVDVFTFLIERLGDDRPREVFDMNCIKETHEKTRLSNGNIFMCPNPVCVWKRKLALKVPFCEELGYNDDVFWYTPLLESRLVKSVKRIDTILYIYKYRRVGSLNQSFQMRDRTYKWAGKGIEYFWLGDCKIVRSLKSVDLVKDKKDIWIVDDHLNKFIVSRSDLKPLCIVKAK